MTKLILKIAITTILSLLLLLAFLGFLPFGYFSIPALYIPSLAAAFICLTHINLPEKYNYLISILAFTLVFVLLVDRTFEMQGHRLTGILFEYQRKNLKYPENLNKTSELKLNSYTPLFGRYEYKDTLEYPDYPFFKLSYTDFWGNHYKYCNKCGEFECKE